MPHAHPRSPRILPRRALRVALVAALVAACDPAAPADPAGDAGPAVLPPDLGPATVDAALEPADGGAALPDAALPARPDASAATPRDAGAAPDAGPDPVAPGQRDPWRRPFASTSIWNTPIGSEAEYVDAEYPVYQANAIDGTWLIRTRASDPRRQFHQPFHWRDRCHADAEPYDRWTHLPDRFVVPDAEMLPNGSWKTPNNQGAFLQPDGRTILNVGGICRDQPGGQLVGWNVGVGAMTDLYGDGRLGGHGASRMSCLGGAIREGELTGDEPIRHALDLILYTMNAATVDGECYRWPAANCDAYASPNHRSNRGRYQGDNPHLQIGSLLALPPELRPEDIGVTTRVGRKLFQAMQDFGGYWTEDSAWEANYFNADFAAEADIAAFHGNRESRSEFGRILGAAHVVANNGPGRVGGGGTPRVARHPELVEP